MINILAERYLYNIQSYLPENINLTLFDPADGIPDELSKADALLIRTVNPINRQTLPSIPDRLSFIGTGSSGTDHVDIDYLEQEHVTFADAAGCNARSVAEYVATALLLWAEHHNSQLRTLSCGVIGVGHVGRQVIALLEKLGITTVAYDPPREQRESNFESATQQEVLNCDILTFHTPLTNEGDYPTYHWLNSRKLANLSFKLVINTSRGGVIDEKALCHSMDAASVHDIIIDVWEDEPQFHLDTFNRAFIRTPHIAGYSVQAKKRASKFVADALINHFDLPRPKEKKKAKPLLLSKQIEEFPSLSDLLTTLHPIKEYEQKLVTIAEKHPRNRGNRFNKLRAEFPLRQEFSNIKLPKSYFDRFPILEKLGFSLADTE